MDKLVNDLGKLFEEFFRQEAGNRLSKFAWVSFKETTMNMIKTYKPEGKNDERKNSKS